MALDSTLRLRLDRGLDHQIEVAARALGSNASAYVRQSVIERLKREGVREGFEMTTWINEANAFISSLENLEREDRKAFYGTREAPGRGGVKAKAAVAQLAKLKARLDRFIRTL